MQIFRYLSFLSWKVLNNSRISSINSGLLESRNSLYTGKLWYRMCSCQPTVGLIIFSLNKFFFIVPKGYSRVGWQLHIRYLSFPVSKEFPAWMLGHDNEKVLGLIDVSFCISLWNSTSTGKKVNFWNWGRWGAWARG